MWSSLRSRGITRIRVAGGAGGGLKAGFPEIQQKMAQARVRDAVATGATDFVTACPFCYQGLQVGITAEGAPIRMRDITELLTMALDDSDEVPGAEEQPENESEKEIEPSE